jgi:primase-polymerase (primpol)-like protein
MSATHTCRHCGERIPWTMRVDAVYCSTRCRVAAMRARRAAEPVIPDELRERPRWVRHIAKRPVTTRGRAASSTDPRTWATHAAAASSSVGDGIGFVLDGDGVVCLDLDHCITGGRVLPWAQRVLDSLPRTYTEVSPSGHGLHVWGVGDVPAGRVIRLEQGTVEVYGSGRYMTVTGRRWGGSPSTLAPLGDVVSVINQQATSRVRP